MRVTLTVDGSLINNSTALDGAVVFYTLLGDGLGSTTGQFKL